MSDKNQIKTTLSGYTNCGALELLFAVEELEIEPTFTRGPTSQNPADRGGIVVESVISDNLYVDITLKGDFALSVDQGDTIKDVLQELLTTETTPKTIEVDETEIDEAVPIVTNWTDRGLYSGNGTITFIKKEDLKYYKKGENNNE